MGQRTGHRVGLFYNAVADWIRESSWNTFDDTDIIEILDVEQIEETGGYCESCAYTKIEVKITYKVSGSSQVNAYYYYGSMAKFINELTKGLRDEDGSGTL